MDNKESRNLNSDINKDLSQNLNTDISTDINRNKETIKEKAKKVLPYFIVVIIYYIMIAVFNGYFGGYFTITKEKIIFDIVWIGSFVTILYMLNKKLRKYVGLAFNIILLIISVVNYFMYSYFGTIFSWKDLILSGDGISFIDSVFKFINYKIIVFIIIGIAFNVVITILCKGNHYKIKSKQSLAIVIIFALLIGTHIYNSRQLSNTSDGWDANEVLNNDSNYYTNWIDPNKLLKICGIYEYIFKDFYMSFLKKDDIESAQETIIEYINSEENLGLEEKKYNGIFKDKNLIFVMMEAMDDWMISEKVTPTIYYMMQHGFNFTNHYSPNYVTGSTSNTEFVANAGIYPNINNMSPHYLYVNNTYAYSIANLFRNAGYVANSFHRSNAGIYNRGNMHRSLGYEKYHSYADMGISTENLSFDSYIAIDGYGKIVRDEKFMSFIITYSPHSPYSYDKPECAKNLEEIEKLNLGFDEEVTSALSAARETDNMFKILLEKLEADNKLEDTVIVAFTDHPNTLVMQEGENEKINSTVFFIYNNEMESNQIETITSTINILPTIKNLFGLESNFIYPGYDALNTDEEYIVFKDYTYYDGNEIKPITEELKNDLEYSKALLVSDYYAE